MGRAAPPRTSRSRLWARRRIWLWRAVASALLALTFGYVPYHLYARSGFARYLQLCAELQGLRASNARLRAENERLSREAEALGGTDLRVLERVARAELGWVLPGEVIFDLGGAERKAESRP
jgi:cell division protein FtsB